MKFLSLLLLFVATTTQASQIVDGGDLFNLADKDKALRALEEIETRTGNETIIETIAFADKKVFKNDTEKNDYFENILLEKARKRKANGLFVLICRTPGRVQVQFDKRLGKTKTDRDAITAAAIAEFRNENWNGGLHAIVAQADKALTVVNRPQPAPVAMQPIQPPQHQQAVVPVAAIAQNAPNKEGNSMVWIVVAVALLAGAAIGLVYWLRPKDIEVPDTNNDEEMYRPSTRSSRPVAPKGSGGQSYVAPTPQPQVQYVPTSSNHNDLVTGMVLGNMMNNPAPAPVYVPVSAPPPAPVYERPKRREPDPEPYSSPSYSSPSYSSPSYDSGSSSSDSGGGFSFDSGSSGFDSGGSSGGDF